MLLLNGNHGLVIPYIRGTVPMADGITETKMIMAPMDLQRVSGMSAAAPRNSTVLMIMMGNVWEWMESPQISGDYLSDSIRSIHGGSYVYNEEHLVPSYRYDSPPFFEHDGSVGFRVASIPEPTTLLLLGMGGLLIRERK